jgi:murein DD-endopeptidase MepM/ murein hydrolase activator NlpD
MPSYLTHARAGTRRRALRRLVATSLVLLLSVAAASSASDVEHRLDQKKRTLDRAEEKQGVLTAELSRSQRRMDRLRARVAALRNDRATVLAELRSAEQELDQAEAELAVAQERLRRATETLKEQLVDIYKLGEIPMVMVLLESDGLDEMTSRAEYLSAVEQSSGSIVDRVREQREQMRATFEFVRDTRDEIAAREAELRSLQTQLATEQVALSRAIADQQAQLGSVRRTEVRLEGGVARLQDEIADRLAAAQAAQSDQSGAAPVPAGPVPGESSSGFIWPVEGALTSPFGMRWGRLHGGIDIAAPGGTPIMAAADGTIVFAQSEAESGGYGNYTCIDHGGGLSTCYAHQSAFETTSGSVEQGQVIGYVGNTGNSFGDHLHFEVRVNGEPVDPMGYL